MQILRSWLLLGTLTYFTEAQGSNIIPMPGEAKIMAQRDVVAKDSIPHDMTLFNKVVPSGTTLWIYNDGYVAIENDFPLEREQLPLGDPNDNPLLLMPFYANTQYFPRRGADKEASVSYAWIQSTASQPADAQALNNISELIRTNAPAGTEFTGHQALIVIWNKMASFSGDVNPDNTPKRNTFQLVLISDSASTYAIFNYDKIEWIPRDWQAQAGFNQGGEGRMFKAPYIGDNIAEIAQRQASSTQGRYVFLISDNEAYPESCFLDDEIYTLRLSRYFGTIFGGDTIYASGPCFDQSQLVQCIFGDKVVDAAYHNPSMVACTPPIQYSLGRVQFKLRVNGITSKAHAYYTIVLPGRIKPGVDALDFGAWTNAEASQQLTIQWNASSLGLLNSSVHVVLFAYLESSGKASWTELQSLSDGLVPNTGQFTFLAGSVRCGEQCNGHEIGAIAVELQTQSASTNTRLWSGYIPLGLFVSSSSRSKWAAQKCRAFYDTDSKDAEWIHSLLDCPCTLDQAVADFGRFQADVGCDMNTGSRCTFHVGALHCVRSVLPTPEGAGNQCCYNKDRQLMYAGDSKYGSTPDRSHSWGSLPYITPGRVPEASHWLQDVVPYYYCCLWTEGSCYIYMDQRPTMDCKGYLSPKSASVFGDPHFISFDGATYTFNGKGEFVLMKTSSEMLGYTLLGRFSQPDASVNATVLRRLAMREGTSDTVEIAANDNQSLESITVYINGKATSFQAPELRWQEFHGPFSISYSPSGQSSSYTVMFASGIGIKVSSVAGSLNAVVMVPPNLKFHASHGLLGTWDDNALNDMEGASESDLTNPDDIQHYGEQQRVRQEDSLFTYHKSSTYEHHNDVSGYQALLVEPTVSDETKNLISSICRDSKQCSFDMAVTNNQELAKASAGMVEQASIFNTMLAPVVACGMPVPHGVRQTNGKGYREGSTVSITSCQPGYNLINADPQAHTCMPNGNWSPPVLAICQFVSFPPLDMRSTENVHNEAVTIALAVTLPIIAIGLGVGLFFFLKTRNQRKQRKVKANSTGDASKANSAYVTHASNQEIPLTEENSSSALATGISSQKTGLSYRVALGEQVPV